MIGNNQERAPPVVFNTVTALAFLLAIYTSWQAFLG